MRVAGEDSERGDPPVFAATVAALALLYATLRWVLPHLAVWVGAAPVPAPVPRFARGIYLLCAIVGTLVFLAADDRRWRLFLDPPTRFLAGEVPGPARPWRRVVLFAIPMFVGWGVWREVMPRVRIPTVIRLQHPTQPEAFAPLRNPLRRLPEDDRRAAEREGMVLYQTNCRPCHGATARGDGPLARGLRLKPVNFADAGTIASVIESYPFWRVQRGHAELPDIATPWNSAMPAWGDQLDDEEIWKILLAEYGLSGTEPRVPEGTEP